MIMSDVSTTNGRKFNNLVALSKAFDIMRYYKLINNEDFISFRQQST